MKKIILILLAIFSVMIFSDESDLFYKRIQVTGTSTETLMPDTASIMFTIYTENEDMNKASEENAGFLERYKTLLSKSGVKYEKIESVTYNSSKREYWDSILVNKGEKEYSTSLNIEITVNDQNKLREIVNILSGENINYFSKSGREFGIYNFNISENAGDTKTSYQKALERYKNLESKVLKTNLVDGVRIASYDTSEKNLEKYDRVKKEKHTVTHVIKIKTGDVKNLGKLINLGYTLNIIPNSYIQYDINNKEQIENRLYEKAYVEAKKKADKILAKTDLGLLKPLSITDNSRYSIQPYNEYFSNYNFLARPDDEVKKSSDKELMDLANTSNLVINPKKLTVTKTVNIEFQMNKK